MASSFERAFNPAFQASMASAMRDMADEKAEKRMQEKLLEQRAYNTMEDTKKEARGLGATAEELGTYSGAENQYALDRRMDELRAEYKAGRTAQLSGEGSGEPTDSLLGETGIATSAGYRKGVESGKSQQQENEFLNRMNQMASAKQREAIRGETDAEASQKIIDSLSRKYPGEEFDANAPLSVLQEQEANFNAREAMNQRAAILGMPQPVPAGLSKTSPDILAAITRSEVEQSALDKAMAGLKAEEIVGKQRNVTLGGAIETQKKASGKEDISTAEARGAQPGLTEAQARLFNTKWQDDKDIEKHVVQRQIDKRIVVGEQALADAASVGYKHKTEKLFNVEVPTRESMFDFTSKYEPITYNRKQMGEDGKPIIDSSGNEMTEKVREWKPRGTKTKATVPPPTTPTGEPDGKVGRFKFWFGR